MTNKNIIDLINRLASVKADASSVVTKNTDQSIGGKKTFVDNSLHSDTLQGRLDTTSVKVQGGLNGGASLELKGKANIGNAVLTAFDGENTSVLALSPDGKLMLNDKDLSKGGAGLEVGDIALAPLGIDETDNCRRYLNGQVILQSQFVAFTEKLKHAITLYPNLATTEQNWQSAVTLSPLGQCGKFVIDDEAGTIRLPKVVNVMGALDLSSIGELQSAGLPNIRGSIRGYACKSSILTYGGKSSGALYHTSSDELGYAAPGSSEWSGRMFNFDASLSNPIYGNSTAVQQEAIKYPYFIQVATSNSEDVQIDTQVRLNNPFSLFMPYWSPIELNNLSWLRSNKQWNNGSVYTSAYSFLVQKFNSGTEKTETIAGVSVTYRLADNGMKIITDKSKYDALISASGSAWFFVLDTANTRFILPYTNGFMQFGNELGKFTEAGLPNIYGNGIIRNFSSNNPADYGAAVGFDSYVGALKAHIKGYPAVPVTPSTAQRTGDAGLEFDASKSNPIYSKSDTVQPNSITGYLYFYVGEVEQDANIIATSGLTESISKKLDIEGASRVGMPSDKYIDLTAIDSSIYTAQADGYFVFSGRINLDGGYVYLRNESVGLVSEHASSKKDYALGVYINAKKGNEVTLRFGNMRDYTFRFIYAEGAK